MMSRCVNEKIRRSDDMQMRKIKNKSVFIATLNPLGVGNN